jgi:hypothetical protein
VGGAYTLVLIRNGARFGTHHQTDANKAGNEEKVQNF